MKLGIVMEGGASRTIYSCGVTEIFMEEGIYPDYFLGVSAGIAYGVSYISKQKGRNRKFTEAYMNDKRYMGLRYWINPRKRCYYNLEFAFGEVPNKLVPFDYETLANFPGKCVACVTNARTGETEFLEIPPFETKWETSIASCSIPIMFQPVKIGDQYYYDGGVSDSIPYKQAFKEGCDKVIVIRTQKRDYVKEPGKHGRLLAILLHKYPKIVEQLNKRTEVYNQTLRELDRLEKEGKVFIFAPKDLHGVKLTEGDWNMLGKLYQEGLDDGRARMEELKAFLTAE